MKRKEYMVLIFFTFIAIVPYYAYSKINSSDSLIRYIHKADAYLDVLKYDSAGYFYEIALRVLDKQDNWTEKCSVYNNYITTLWRQDQLDKAGNLARKNLDHCLQYLGANNPVTGDCMLNMGILSFLVGPFDMMSVYFRKALHIYENNYGHFHPKTAIANEWLGTTYEHQGERDKAKYYLFKSFDIWKKTKGENHPDLGNIYRYLGLYYKRYGKLDSALICLNQAMKLFDEKLGKRNYKSVKCINNMCDIFEVEGNFDTALVLYNHALELLDRNNTSHKPVILMTYFNIAEYYIRKLDYLNGINYLQNIYSLYSSGFNYNDIYLNPPQCENGLRRYYLNLILFYKARAFKELYKKDTVNGVKYLKGAFDCYSLAGKILEEERRFITNYNDLLSFSNRHASLMLEMAINALRLYSHSGNDEYYTIALQYMEKSKSMELISRLSSGSMANKYFPQQLQAARRKIQDEYLYLKDSLVSVKDSSMLGRINEELINKSIELDMFNWKCKQDYPAFEYIPHHTKTFTIQEIQKKLNDNQVIIEFEEFCGDYKSIPREIITMIISKSSIDYKIINGFSAVQLIKKYYELLSKRENRTKIDSVGDKVYHLFFKPVEYLSDVNELIIIPSQHTSLIPFDALNAGYSENGQPRYLIYDYTSWKVFSIRDYLENYRPTVSDENKLMAMAPEFSSEKRMEISRLARRDTSLISLIGAKAECEKISHYFPTKLIMGRKATETSFKSLSVKHPLIHLSTHGVPSDSTERFIQLAFSNIGDDKENGYLNMFEIFKMQLSAELVVLSACKTGIGELNKGEGNLSLAWAFNKAGARSTVVCLWDANDYASSIIMPAFYKYLSEGYKKPQALRQAKLEFLKASDELMSNPYFWSGFEYYGDDEEILMLKRQGRHAFYIGIVILMALGLSVLILNRRRKESIQ